MPFPVAGPVEEVATLHACAASVSARGEPYAYQGSFEVMAPVRTPGVENPPASTSWGSGPDVVGFGRGCYGYLRVPRYGRAGITAPPRGSLLPRHSGGPRSPVGPARRYARGRPGAGPAPSRTLRLPGRAGDSRRAARRCGRPVRRPVP